MVRKVLLTAVAAGAAFAAAGCRHRCCSSSASATPRPYLPLPPSVAPGGAGLIPPPGVPVTPPPGGQLPPSGGQLPPPDFGAVPGPPPATKGPAPEILLPDPVPNGRSSRSDSPITPPGVLGGPGRPPSVTQEPPVAPPTDATAGLPGFVRVKDGVASGRKPALEGFDTLKRTGFKSVVYLHPAGADVAAVRDVAEKKGLAFSEIETTPEKLPDAVAAFDRVLADRATQPVYVFDDDGLRAGVLWYVHLRTADQLSPEVARIRARGLGLTDETDEARAFWVAIQQHLGR